MRILTAAQSRELDRWAIEQLGLPGAVLMENAALGLADALLGELPGAQRVTIVCGPGNNGGDGLALARQLAARGHFPRVALARLGRDLSADCAAQLALCRGLGLTVEEISAGEPPVGASAAEVIVDALFGTGLARPLEGEAARLVERLARLPVPKLAVDLPSGLDADRARPLGPVLPAAWTVTFGTLKAAHVLDPAAELCGEVMVADLGFPVEASDLPTNLAFLLADEARGWLVPRPRAAHKGSFGHVLLVAGSRGMAGAAILSARAAVRGGAGLVTVAAPTELLPALAAASPESMTIGLAQTSSGGIAAGAVETLRAAAAARTVVAAGPGLGRDEATLAALASFALRVERPLVLDADGLAPFEGRLEHLAARPGATVLTPHPGELARLLDRPVDAVQADRVGAAREAAARAGAVVALKGHRSVVAAPDGEAWINSTGCAAMASGGSGDVLTGLLAARLAQGDEPEVAAALAVHLHGLAGELAAERLGGPALPAAELAEALPEAYRRLAAT